jgi:hypothetical protein
MKLIFALLAVVAFAVPAVAASRDVTYRDYHRTTNARAEYRETVRRPYCGEHDWSCNHIDQAVWQQHD